MPEKDVVLFKSYKVTFNVLKFDMKLLIESLVFYHFPYAICLGCVT